MEAEAEHINYVKFFEQIILNEFMRLSKEQRATITEVLVSKFGDFDTFSLIWSDAYDEIMNTFDELDGDTMYFLRRCAFAAGRALVEELNVTEHLDKLLNKSMRHGIEQAIDFFTDEDVDNDRIMHDRDLELPAIMVTLCIELLDQTPEEVIGGENAKGAVST